MRIQNHIEDAEQGSNDIFQNILDIWFTAKKNEA